MVGGEGSEMIPNIRIDGVTVEPSPADDPDAMGPTAVDIDCDLDALALKVGTRAI